MDNILIYGSWPDPRCSGISNIIDGTINGFNKAGIDVSLVIESEGTKQSLGPESVCLIKVPGKERYNWKEAVDRREAFVDLSEMATREAELLKGTRIIHTHLDDLIPPYEGTKSKKNNYLLLRAAIEELSGRKPKLVRTRHEEVRATIDRINRLTGTDWERLPLTTKQAFLADGRSIKEVVDYNIRRNGKKMQEKYGLTDKELHKSIDHVWYGLHQLRLWRREADDCDAIVSLTQESAEESRKLTMQEGAEEKFVVVNNGISFNPNQQIVDGLVYNYHCHQGLRAYRGANPEMENIGFKPSDKKVIFVGRPRKDKGIIELTRSLNKLNEENQKVYILFVGDFNLETRTELVRENPQNERNLLFTGMIGDVDELASIYRFGDVTAAPSHHIESCLLAGLESLAMGTPVVVTDFAGSGEVYIKIPERLRKPVALPVKKPYNRGPDKYYGIDQESLTKQLGRILSDEALGYRLGENGKELVKSYFTADRMAREYLKLFERLEKDQ